VSDAALLARCHCGATSILGEASAQGALHCHCGLCRRLSGAAFTTWVSLPDAGSRIEGGARLRRYAATPNVERHFCAHCGTHLFTRDRRYPGVLGVPAGVLTGAVPAPSGNYFWHDRAPWCDDAQALPRFGGAGGFEPLGDDDNEEPRR
jgi:hypothetical protein